MRVIELARSSTSSSTGRVAPHDLSRVVPRAKEAINMRDAKKKEVTEDREPVGGQPQEPVEDRPNVSTTKPEEYPEGNRAKG